MIDRIFNLRRAGETGTLAIGHHFLEQMAILLFLTRGKNETRNRCCVLRFEFRNRLKVARIRDHLGELLQLL